MKGKILTLAIAACMAGATASAAPAVQPLNRYSVELRPGVNTQHVVDTLRANGVEVLRVIQDREGDILAVRIDRNNPPDLKKLQSLAGYVRTYGIDVGRRVQALDEPITDITVDGEVIPWGIQAVGSEDVSFGGGRKVCIIDTGFAQGHPDLQSSGVDGTDRGAGPWSTDGHGHGTHVAGTIAALGGNGQGVKGVIQDGGAELFIVRAFNGDGGFVYATELSGAMLDCAAAGANVISMSLGGDFSSPLEERVVTKLHRQGILLIAAAGNGTGNAGGVGPSWYNSYSYPASYSSVMSVAALDPVLARASFSQRNRAVDIAAPGVGVVSLAPGGGTASMDGTSMATPHVSGVAALVWSNFKQCSNTEIATALKNSATDLDAAGYDVNTGWGLVQAPAAMAYLAANPCTGRR